MVPLNCGLKSFQAVSVHVSTGGEGKCLCERTGKCDRGARQPRVGWVPVRSLMSLIKGTLVIS